MIPFWQLGILPKEENNTHSVANSKLNYFGTDRHGLVQSSKLSTDNTKYKQPSGGKAYWQHGQVSRLGFSNEYSEEINAEALVKGYKTYAVLSGAKQQLYGEDIDGWVFKDSQGIRWLIQLEFPEDMTHFFSVNGVGNSIYINYTIKQFGIINPDPNAVYKTYTGTLHISDLGLSDIYFDTGELMGSHVPWCYSIYWAWCGPGYPPNWVCAYVEPGDYVNFTLVDIKPDGSQAILMVSTDERISHGATRINGAWDMLFAPIADTDQIPISFIGINCTSVPPSEDTNTYNPPVLSFTVLRDIHQTVGDYKCSDESSACYPNSYVFEDFNSCGGPGNFTLTIRIIGGENYGDEVCSVKTVSGGKDILYALFYEEDGSLSEVRVDRCFEKLQDIRSINVINPTISEGAPFEIEVSGVVKYTLITELKCNGNSVKLEFEQDLDTTTHTIIECYGNSQLKETTIRTGYDHFTIREDNLDVGILLGTEYIPEENSTIIDLTNPVYWNIDCNVPSAGSGCEMGYHVEGRFQTDTHIYWLHIWEDKYFFPPNYPNLDTSGVFNSWIYNGEVHTDGFAFITVKRYSYNTFGLSVGTVPWSIYEHEFPLGPNVNTSYMEYSWNEWHQKMEYYWLGPSLVLYYGDGITPKSKVSKAFMNYPMLPRVNFSERYGTYNVYGTNDSTSAKLGSNVPVCYV